VTYNNDTVKGGHGHGAWRFCRRLERPPPPLQLNSVHFVRSCPPDLRIAAGAATSSSPPSCFAFFHSVTLYSSANSFSSYTMDSPLENAPSPAESVKKGRKRVRKFTSSDRALHRMIEKQRREDLNDRFLVSRTRPLSSSQARLAALAHVSLRFRI